LPKFRASLKAIILLEGLLRTHALRALQRRGFSKNKIKSIKDELTFNGCLNLILPLTISPSESKKIQQNVHKVDRLRRIRNDIIHDDLAEADIDENEIKGGIDAAIALLSFLQKKAK
jgi:hypothetical protein